MKAMKPKAIKTFYTLIALFTFTACDDLLEPETFTTLAPDDFFNSAADAEAALNGVYAPSQGYRDLVRDYLTFGEFTTDIAIERAGAINAFTQPIEDFDFAPSHNWLQGFWVRRYNAIYRANVVLDNVPGIDMDENRKQQILAEARFLRAYNYFYLYDLFGPVPIIETSETAAADRPARPGEEEFIAFVENDLRAAGEALPPTWPAQEFGRATSGAALGYLAKFHLNNKKWAEAADAAQEIIETGVHSLFAGESRADLFALANEGHREFVFVVPFPDNVSGGDGNTYLSHAAPPGYQFQTDKVNFAAQFKIRSEFLGLFEPEDQRLDAFVFEYVNTNGDTVQLGQDDVRSFKYPEDPEGFGDVSGNDFPLLRYADILLSRAEALNELDGPNQESVDLINEVREAAGVDPVELSDYPDRGALRDFILDERGREFHTEALRRQDLIRHGKFIEMAQARDKPAAAHHVRFPIPQSELDRNANLEQNDGY